MASLKKNLYLLYKIFFQYHAGFSYVFYRYWIAPKIFNCGRILEKEITHHNVSIHMLTCHRDILIAVWSLASFYRASHVIGHLTIHDDGTLTQRDVQILHTVFPSAHIVRVEDFMTRHGHELVAYPVLHTFREKYKKFQSKKLLDVYFERQGDIVLFLDSDLLWFQAPQEIEEAISNDAENVSHLMSNGNDRVHVTFKDGTTTTDDVAECNSGVTLYNVKNYSLTDVSTYVAQCDYMNKKFTDQACFGTVLKHRKILPRETYFIKGTITDKTVMRHYTGPSREKFYFYGINFLYKDILK